MNQETIRSIVKQSLAEMRTKAVRTSRSRGTLTRESWQNFADALCERGLDADVKDDGVVFEGGHLAAEVVNGGANIALALHDEGDVLRGVDTYGESFEVRKGNALMPNDGGAIGLPGTVVCIEFDGQRLCLSADNVRRVAELLMTAQVNK